LHFFFEPPPTMIFFADNFFVEGDEDEDEDEDEDKDVVVVVVVVVDGTI